MKKLPHSKCLICHKETNRTTTKYCSVKCRGLSHRGIRQGGPKLKVLPRPCIQCKKIFSPVGYKDKTKYCSKRCMGLARADFCAELGRKMRGKKFSKATRKKLSIAASKRNASRQYSKGLGGKRKDLGHYVRSRWEANIARFLKLIYGTYKYEPDTFALDDGNNFYCYTPDFKVHNFYYEVKGYWDHKSLIKKKLMKLQYPNIKIYYVNQLEYEKIKQYYSSVIKHWEK